MLTRTEPVTIVAYAEWNIGGKPAKRGDGSNTEYVEFKVDGEYEARKVTLDQSINGDRAAVGTRAALDIEYVPRPVVATGQDGRAFAAFKDKLTVRAMHAAK